VYRDYTLVIELRARSDVDLDRLVVFACACCWSTAVCLLSSSGADNRLIVGVIVFVFATCVFELKLNLFVSGFVVNERHLAKSIFRMLLF
jgi:hypothetical protein